MQDPSKEIVDVVAHGTGLTNNLSPTECLVVGDWIYLSGQTPDDADAISSDFEDQVRQTFRNIERALRSAGSSLEDMVHMTVWLSDMRYSERFVELREEILEANFTTSSLIGVRALPNPEHMLKIEVRAIRSDATLTKDVVKVPELRDPIERGRSYHHCITVGDWIHLAGQVPVDGNHQVVSSNFEEQVRTVFNNIDVALSAAESDLDDIIHMTVWVRDIRYANEFVEIREDIMGDRLLPTSTLIGTRGLGDPEYKVEIEVKAVKSDGELKKSVVDVPALVAATDRNRSYEHCVTVGDWVYLAGQVAFDESNVVSGIDAQVSQVFENVGAALEAADSSLDDIVHMRIYPADMRNALAFLAQQETILGDTPTTTSWVDPSGLANVNFQLEIEVIAAK